MVATGVGVSCVLAYVLYFFVWRLMNRLSTQNAKLSEFNDLKNKFIGIVAHDLRSPITIFKGYSDILLNDVVGKTIEPQKNVLRKMNNTSENMLELINDLLDLSNIESGKLELKKEKVKISKYLKMVYGEISLLAKYKSINLKLNCEPNIPDTNIDHHRISQAINNLVTNAVKFSYPNTEVLLRAEKLRDDIKISVIDHGQGIPQDEISKIFSDFTKTSIKPTAGEKSTGLGLAITKRIIEAHNGNIWVKSQVNKGSILSFTLPTKTANM